MRLRPVLFALPVLLVAFLATGCFSSRTAGTVSTPITVQSGTTETEVNPNAGSTNGSTTGTTAPTTTAATTTSGGSTATTGTSGGGGAPAFPASAKGTFSTTCGGCHTLADAGTHGNVGPNLDQLKPDEQTVAHQIENGGGGMPAGLLKGDALTGVAQYVSAVAGKGGGSDTSSGGTP
jgi:Cytochrome C oxidase, cbb3-type, subunit III